MRSRSAVSRSTRSRTALVVVALFALAACADDGDAAESASTDAPAADTAPADTAPPDTEPGDTEPTDTAAADSASDTATPDTAAAAEPGDTEPGDAAPPDTEPAARTYDFAAIDPIVSEFVESRELNGAGLVVVDRNDGIVYEGYWGVFDADRISLIASSSKMISAGVLLHLDDEGVLDIDAPVADVADWGAGNPDITPAQLISNSSGLVGLLPDPTYAPYLCQYIFSETLQGCAAAIFTSPEDDAQIVPPDTEFRYGGAQWTVAGGVAEAASGQPWTELIDEIYVQPCGLDSLQFNNHFAQIGSGGFDYPVEFDSDPSQLAATENPNPEGGAYISAPDYGRLLLMHLNDGRCGDAQVLSPEALDVMHADRVAAAYAGNAGAGGDGSAGTGYGMGWWVDRDSGRISDGGAYGSQPWLDLDNGYGAYLVIEADSGTGNELADLLYDEVESAVLGT